MATAILTGRQRRLHPRYQALASHYNFDPLFCMPARDNEKPHVGNRVKNLQRRWATPVPQVRDMAELNAYLGECCEQDLARVATGQSETIGTRFEQERATAVSLPKRRFDACISDPRPVDKYQTIACDNNRYSVPRAFAFQTATVSRVQEAVESCRSAHWPVDLILGRTVQLSQSPARCELVLGQTESPATDCVEIRLDSRTPPCVHVPQPNLKCFDQFLVTGGHHDGEVQRSNLTLEGEPQATPLADDAGGVREAGAGTLRTGQPADYQQLALQRGEPGVPRRADDRGVAGPPDSSLSHLRDEWRAHLAERKP